MEGVATPGSPSDLDLYLERQSADGTWTKVADGANGSALDGESIATGRLAPGSYRLEVHDYAGVPGDTVDVKLTFFDSKGRAGS